MNKRETSTFDKIMRDPKRKAKFDKGYEEFLLSEFIIEAMDKEKTSVRKLSAQTGVSSTMIQNLRSGKSKNISIKTLIPILTALRYRIRFEKIHK
jgi:DNA-binding Xre family transcriptional regulator